MGFYRHITACNTVDYSQTVPFMIDGTQYGTAWAEYAPRFASTAGFDFDGTALHLTTPHTQPHDRTQHIRDCLQPLCQNGDFPELWGEDYPVVLGANDTPALCLDRTFVPLLGIRAWGVHVNGYTVDSNGTTHMWIARRSPSKKHYPNKLDNMTAGGQPVGITPWDNMAKELAEETGISLANHPQLQPQNVGEITYTHTMTWADKQGQTWHGVRPDTMICYDIKMPHPTGDTIHDIIPTPTDGEVAEFSLIPITQVLNTIATTDNFKPNCTLAIIHHALRHNLITPKTATDHADLRVGLGLA